MKKRIWIIGISLTAAVNTWAIDVTLESAAELALGNNKSLSAAYAEQRPLTRGKNSVWNEFFPELYTAGRLNRINQNSSFIDTSTNQWYFLFSVGASLELSAGTIFRMNQARQAWEQGLIDVKEYEHTIVRDSRKGFLGLLLLRDTISIYENMVSTAEARYSRAKRRFEIGDARKLDMLSFQVAWQNMIPQLTSLKNQYAVNELQFRRLLGLPDDEPVKLLGEIVADEQSWDARTLISSRLGERYDVRTAQTLIRRLETEKGIRVSSGLTPTFKMGYDFSPMYIDPSDAGEDLGWYDYTGGLHFGVVLPLDGFVPNTKKNLAVKEMTDYINAAQQTLADTLQAGAIEIESAVLSLNKSGSTLRSLELNVELAVESYDLVSRSYDVGEADYLQVQTADDDLNTARIQLLNEKFNYAAALQDLNYAIARELDVQAKPIEPQDTKE